jgi:hypothetical protein
MQIKILITSAVIAASLIGCGGGGTAATTQKQPQQYTFKNDLYPLFSAQCIQCHGQHGNFSVTTPEETYRLLLDVPPRSAGYDYFVKPKDPEASLILYKPTNIVLHGGGERFDVNSTTYRILKSWIEEGAKFE